MGVHECRFLFIIQIEAGDICGRARCRRRIRRHDHEALFVRNGAACGIVVGALLLKQHREGGLLLVSEDLVVDFLVDGRRTGFDH